MLRFLFCLFLLVSSSNFLMAQAADFSVSPTPSNRCAPVQIQCFDLSTGATSWLWTVFGPSSNPASSNQNPAFTLIEPGAYTIELSINGGVDSHSEQITVHSLPEADFTADQTSGCLGMEVQFTDLTLAGDAAISNWFWDLGTGMTSPQQNPLATYPVTGIWDVELVVTDANGCMGHVEKVSYISTVGIGFDFTGNPRFANCPPLLVDFETIPPIHSEEVDYVKWYFDLGNDFGYNGGNVLEGQTTGSNIYISGGPDGQGFFDVALVIGQDGCRDSIYKNNYIYVGGQSGSFDFSPDTAYVGEEVTFFPIAVERTDSIFWDFGGGQTLKTSANINMVEVTYDVAGVYEPIILLEVADCPPILVGPDKRLVIEEFDSSYLIQGRVFYDENQDGGFDPEEEGLSHLPLEITPGGITTFGNSEGLTFDVEGDGSYSLSWPGHQDWMLTTPSNSYDLTLPQPVAAIYDFGLYPTSLYELVIPNISSFPNRCNQDVGFWLNYTNFGTMTTGGTISFTADSLTTFETSNPLPDNVNGNIYTWNFNDLPIGGNATIEILLAMPGTNAIGDSLFYTATAYLVDQFDMVIDSFRTGLAQELRCSYDPNDKTASPPGVGEDHLTLKDAQFNYMVRFQNTGNDTAFQVVITDLLDPNLDLTTFKVVNYSHEVSASINEVSGELTFTFPEIMLPDSTTDLEGSQGFVTYSIDPVSPLVDSTIIQNTANIYFDQNPAIITNTVFNTMVDQVGNQTTTNVLDSNTGRLLAMIYPNPAGEYAVIKFEEGQSQDQVVELLDASGRVIRLLQTSGSEYVRVERNGLPSGIYMLRLTDLVSKRPTGSSILIFK
ncbi:MAG: T9SS type A sorting domain-containing protein [Bacteroidetes bacterium]|nr:T9SS type A sorting domain-containing protein [Bacteroidota bacterium]